MEVIKHIKVSVWYDAPRDFVGYVTIINKFHPNNNMTSYSDGSRGNSDLILYTIDQFEFLKALFLMKNIVMETTDLTRKDK